MADHELIASVRAGDVPRVRRLVVDSDCAQARDTHGWTALHWAAGAGHAALVELLLAANADPFARGDDGRTPYEVALAAGRAETARRLADAETRADAAAAGESSGRGARRPYCRAYELRELRRFPAWCETRAPGSGPDAAALTDDTMVFVHRDFSVTRTIWPGEGLVFDDPTESWKQFCREQLEFEAPTDFTWLPVSPG